jgi:hypothetical protein
MWMETGRMPAIVGMDVGDFADDPIQSAIDAWHNSGQIVTYSWHIGAPPGDDSSLDNSRDAVDVRRVLRAGTTERLAYLAKLDKMAFRLEKLDAVGVPILWRPFHEANGDWFWWSRGGAELYVQLWLDMYHYFTDVRGLNNLIWVWSVAQTGPPVADWYPGDDYVDVVGSDTYAPSSEVGTWRAHFEAHRSIAAKKPFALSETDFMPESERLLAQGVNAVWFLTWNTRWIDMNSLERKRAVYNSRTVITADELPEFS